MADNMPTLEEFTGLKLAGLDDSDTAVLNLCVARGLPGTEKLDVAALLDKLDEWAEAVKFEICRHLYRFEIRPTGRRPSSITAIPSLVSSAGTCCRFSNRTVASRITPTVSSIPFSATPKTFS
jgi:hypothetical protein